MIEKKRMRKLFDAIPRYWGSVHPIFGLNEALVLVSDPIKAGKLGTRCLGPYTFLQAVGSNIMAIELMSQDDRIRIVAANNLI